MTDTNVFTPFGNDAVRALKIEKLAKLGMQKASDSHIENLMSRRSKVLGRGHVIGFFGEKENGCLHLDTIGNNPRILMGFCVEEYPTISNYMALEVAKHFNLEKRLILPSFEFLHTKIRNGDEIRRYTEKALPFLSKYDVKVIDTLNDIPYKADRFDVYFQAQRVSSTTEHLDDLDERLRIGKLMTLCQVADVLLSLRDRDTLVIADQGSVGPVLEAKNLAGRLNISNKLSMLVYLEPLDLIGQNLMFYGRPEDKIFVTEDPHIEAEKIMRATTAHGTPKEFKAKGGNYFGCPVAEIESIIFPHQNCDLPGKEKCVSGGYSSCLEHKKEVRKHLENFLESIQKGVI